jgi:hypothetical protein
VRETDEGDSEDHARRRGVPHRLRPDRSSCGLDRVGGAPRCWRPSCWWCWW